MTITEMSLPVDVPWKRMGVSGDMIDKQYGDLIFPEKWRSSIAVFYHEPSDLPPEYCNRKITYLKVVCTISNFQYSSEDITALQALREVHGEWYGLKEFEYKTANAFPCYGALLQVGVFPNPSVGISLHDFPYISSFQPRKREMYETLSESGEALSHSGVKVNLTKGGTTTDTTEQYDLTQGGEGHSFLFGAYSINKGQEQKGTVGKTQSEKQDLRTTDTSRENRETHSYSTTINQLYSLLESYHLGSNRSMFFMQPRPHIQDLKFTFVTGPRRLEGIQEFFLIVNRPANIPGLCVEVALETAHLYQIKWYYPRLIPLHELYSSGNLSKTSSALGLGSIVGSVWKDEVFQAESWNKHDAWTRFLTSEAITKTPGAVPPEIEDVITNGWMTWDEYAAMRQVLKKLPSIGTENVALIFEEYLTDSGYLFVSARKLASCMKSAIGNNDNDTIYGMDIEHSDSNNVYEAPRNPSIVVEKKYNGNQYKKPPNGLANAADLKTDFDLVGMNFNYMIQAVNETLWSSLGSTDRYPYGMLSFMETDFMLEELSQLVRVLKNNELKDKPLDKIPDLSTLAKTCIDKLEGVKNIFDLGTLTTEKVSHDLRLTNLEAKKIRYELLMKSLKELDVKSTKEIKPINTIIERFNIEYPKGTLEEFEKSAKIFTEVIHAKTKKTRRRISNKNSKHIKHIKENEQNKPIERR